MRPLVRPVKDKCRLGPCTVLRRPPVATVLLCAILASLSGCAGGNARPVTEAERRALEREAAAPPKLQAGDKIHVTVYNEPTLSGDFQIDPSGLVSLPLAGTVNAAGLTQRELEQELETKLGSGYLKNPQITVGVAEFRPIYIVGEVEKPGAYPYTGGLTALSAIAIAGGATYRADQSEVEIQHAGDSEMHAYDMSAPIPILPGDIIKVPRRYI
jgi:protein involved in polysaccharide export with SLBB domain